MSYLLKQSLAFGKQDSFILLLLKQNHVLWISDCILTYNSFRRASCLSFHLFSLNVSCFSLKLLTVFVRSLSPQSWQFAEALYISVFCFFFGGGGWEGKGELFFIHLTHFLWDFVNVFLVTPQTSVIPPTPAF